MNLAQLLGIFEMVNHSTCNLKLLENSFGTTINTNFYKNPLGLIKWKILLITNAITLHLYFNRVIKSYRISLSTWPYTLNIF